MPPSDKRERLVQSAAHLFYQKGMHNTSLADISAHAEVPIGNVYYYFKTKEELVMAALSKRKDAMEHAYKNLDSSISDPRERLIQAVSFFDSIREDYTKYGCPIGKTIIVGTMEDKKVVELAHKIFEDFVSWAAKQFASLGHTEKQREYAISLMAGIEGAAVMAKAYGEEMIISQEVARLIQWLKALPNKRIFLGKGGAAAPSSLEDAG